jgi:hypothetical protein
MDKQNRPEGLGKDDNLRSSEFYNRPGSTEHNDYRIGAKSKKISADKNNKKEDTAGEDKNIETGQ